MALLAHHPVEGCTARSGGATLRTQALARGTHSETLGNFLSCLSCSWFELGCSSDS